MPFQHHIRDAVMRDKARTRLYKEPRKDRWTTRDNRRARNATRHKEPRCNPVAMSEDGEDNWHQGTKHETATTGKQGKC
jgi:hypothetical protein